MAAKAPTPDEVEKVLDQRSSMAAIGPDMDAYTKYQVASAMPDAMKGGGDGGLAGAGMGAGTTWLFTPEYESPSFEAVSLASAAGGWLGFHLVHALLETEEPQNETGRSDAGSPQPRVHLMLENAGALLLARETGTACRAPLVVVKF